MSAGPPHDPPCCRFDHPGFAALGRVVFRRTRDDGVAALALDLGGPAAVLPLATVAQAFGIGPDTGDGRMLRRIAAALCFVGEIRLGDPLPSEVVTGEASWRPSPYHRQVASARLQMELVAWIGRDGRPLGAGDGRITSRMLVVSIDDPAVRPRVQDALRRIATELGLQGTDLEAGRRQVAGLLDALAGELAYVEALRERLLDPVRGMLSGLGRIGGTPGLPPARRETLFQVTQLTMTAVADVARRFDAVDALTQAIVPALRHLDRRRGVLRRHRDALFGTLLEWQPLLDAWRGMGTEAAHEDTWKVVEQAYRFLAPRYMTVQEWPGPAIDRERSAGR